MGKRYLIVIDDIWSLEAWDHLKLFLPHENTGSRILLTSRLNEVALHAKPHGFIYFLPYLTEEQSWELLRKKVFHEEECPEWLIESGMQIAKKCEGLPLSLVVMAGVLSKEAMSKDLWQKIACSSSSHIVSEHKGYLETLALSYHHLPYHLRECFLYLGGFPEDFRFAAEKLIWLWGAEGFIEEDGNQSMEVTAKAYLMDLIDRNLLIITERKFDGDVKACKLHDLVRELCREKAIEERFFLIIDRPLSPPLYEVTTVNEVTTPYEAITPVLDLQKHALVNFPQDIALLVHLRYLAIHIGLSGLSLDFPSAICNLWSLQILIVKTNESLNLPSNISDLVNLRHLWCSNTFYLHSIDRPMNLQSISYVVLGKGVENLHKCFPRIKKLASPLYSDGVSDFESLPCLETLQLTEWVICEGKSIKLGFPKCGNNHIRFPAALTKLTLAWCCLPWSDISIIQTLPNLEFLKLRHYAFVGPLWNMGEGEFRRLRFLRLERLDIKQWEVCSINFPYLRRLQMMACNDLKDISLDIGDILTLELLEVNSQRVSVFKSLQKIQFEQHDLGNDELKINFNGEDLASFSLEYDEVSFRNNWRFS